MVSIRERATLSAALRRELEALLPGLGTLEEVLRWAFALSPPRNISDVVVQDEYSHDVVLPWQPEHYLVFDTT